MKIIILALLTVLFSCSSNKKSTKQSMLSNRDCNTESARFTGKDYVQKDNQLNSVAFDHCTKADTNNKQPYEVKRSQSKNPTVSNALMYKCEVVVNGNSYAVSNKVRSNAKDRVIKKCFTYEKSEACSDARCLGL